MVFRALEQHVLGVLTCAVEESYEVEHATDLLARCGAAMLHARDHRAAMRVNALVLAQRVDMLGDRHHDMLTSRNNLASSYQSACRHLPINARFERLRFRHGLVLKTDQRWRERHCSDR